MRAYDPEGVEQARAMLEGVTFVEGPYAAIEDADAVVIVTEWDEFRALDLNRVAALLRTPVMIDLRNIYTAEEAARAGLSLVGVGKPAKVVRAAEAVA